MTKNISQETDIKLKCLVVDNEEIAIEGVINYIEKVDFLELSNICSSAIEAAGVLKRKSIDLMFLDINMPDISGLDFLESLDKAPITIFTTAYSEYALDGFRLNAVDYLLKPYSFKRFFQAVQKASALFQSHIVLRKSDDEKQTTDMYIRQGDSFQRIVWEDILFVEAMQNYVKLHLKTKMFVVHQTMTSLEEFLPKDSFFRIHQSYLVNISYINIISGGRLYIEGNELPISKHRKEDLLNTVVYKNLISK
jgi:DNA-binding LytR/AlgR family response regulator